MPVAQRLVRIRLVTRLLETLDCAHRGGRMHVVDQRRRPGEALVAHELLVIDAAVGFAEGDVAFAGDLSERVIDRHYRLPLAACSRSIASNNALKFPLPNDFAPFRWMISKNRVGRSWTG